MNLMPREVGILGEGNMATVLIVDDDVLSREFLLALLSYGGHRLLQAADGVQGLKVAHEEIPDLIITDILMPHMDGYEFVSRLHADPQLPDIPIIFYTANYREREASIMAVACYVHWVLSKPSAPDLILSRVHEALGLPLAKGAHPEISAPPSEVSRFTSIDNQVSEYLFELEASSHLISQVAKCDDKSLLQMSQSIEKSLASLQAVSLRLTALIDLGIQLAAERDDVSLIKAGCKVAQNICVAKYAVVGMLDSAGDKLQHFVTRGLDDASQQLIGIPLPNQGVLGTLLKFKAPQRIGKVGGAAQTLGFDESHPPIHSFLGVPILSKNKSYGWLYLVDKLGSDEFSEVDERVAITLSAQLAVTYENLILMDELRRNHVRLQAEMAARMRGDDELRRFRTAMDASADGIFLIDRAAMRLVDVNDTACRMLGYGRDELLTMRRENIGKGMDDQLRQLFNSLVAYQGVAGTSELELMHKDGTQFPSEIVRRIVQSKDHWIMVTIVRDITARKETEQRLLQLAHYDPLTGLPNRMLFYNTLTHALKQAEEHQLQVAILFIDLDRFKNVNDTLGHPIGDELLRQFALRVLSCVRVRDTIGRIGGDEFALILTIPEGQQTAAVVAAKIQDALHRPFDLRGHEVTVAVSIGITIYPDDAQDPETLIKFADTAMYQAKESGRDTYRFFTQEMNTQAHKRLELENALRRALENSEFTLQYQPQVSIATGKIIGAEALIRWMRPGHGLISPAEFIPILEETGLIVRVGAWVIRTACKQIGTWLRTLPRPIQVAVNVSGKQFFDTHMEDEVMAAIKASDIPPELLEIELTESALMANAAQTIVLLGRLNDLGVKMSIDDFGTGYSSLAYLKRFPIDKLKIDIAFIREVTTNSDDAAITKAIIDMGHNLKLAVIAEGVETQAQLAFLRENGCDEIQGYYFSRPVSPTEFEQMIVTEKTLPATSDDVRT
jgi:diguanylate cyclase (GGDEF)-like protein/PAS domain S-box-containing protein